MPGCPLLDSGQLGDKHMYNIRVLVHTKDLSRLRVPAFAGRVRAELCSKLVGCGIRNPLCD